MSSTKIRTEGKVFPVHAMKMCRGGEGIGPLILNLRTGWRQVVNFTPQHLYPQKTVLVPIEW